jgi:ABC-type amino acid transport substrate-binding protein
MTCQRHVLLLGTALVAARVVSSSPALARDLRELKASGMLRVLVAADESPEFFAFTPGTPPGFEREMLEAFARLHKVELKVVRIARFDDIITALLRGDGDIITGIIDTEARRRQVAFSVEVLPARQLVVTRGPKLVRSVAELPSERVGVVSGTAWGEAALAAGVPAGRIESLPDMAALLAALRSAKVTAVVVSLSDFVLERRRAPDLLAGPFLGGARSAAWAVRRGDAQLLRAMNEHIENLRRTPSWSRMAVTYFGRDALSLLGRAKTE